MAETTQDTGAVLDLEKLRTALNSVVDLAVERFGPTVDINASHSLVDYYWHLPVKPAMTMAEAPGQHIDAGQLSDDLAELADMVQDPDSQVLWHSATHLSELLRLLAFLDLNWACGSTRGVRAAIVRETHAACDCVHPRRALTTSRPALP